MAQRWAAVPRSTCLALGLDGDGVCALDLAVDGPHALVGGTTGSGKSELLRTLVASLAVVNRPDELVFVLVDYKGGAAFAEAADLPHTVGLITDLDPHLANRALTSLTAELKRRERLMARGGARDLDEYQSRGQGPGLARLVLVIDEFRALAEELPAFLDGLVRIAALGRSLGVHLVLATQRPGGIVSADVRANVNLRIALRVRDASDSHDVIDCPDAAALPERLPGRALVRTGVEPPRAVQVARVIEPEKASPPASDLQVRVLDTLWPDPPDQRPAAASPPPGQQAASSTDEPTSLLERIATSTRLAAELVGAAPPPSPWLAALPDFVPVARLADEPAWHQQGTDEQDTDKKASGHEVVGQTRACAAPVLLLDLPARQVQRPVTWDPLVDGHLAVVGAPRSGRTTLARTAVAGLVKRCSPAALHVYGFDFGGGMSPVATLPHTGAWVEGEEVARGARVLDGLAAIVAQRRRDVAAAGATSVLEAAGRAGEAMPVLAVVIDGWPQFVEAYGELGRGRLLEVTHQLLRDGPAMGLVALVTGDRTLLTARVSALLPQLWSLRMVDPADLLMAGLSRAQIPDRMPPGRVVRLSDGAVGQVAVIGDAPDGVAQVGALLSLAQQVGGGPDPSAEAPPGGPWTVRRLPRQVSLADLPQSVVPDPPMGSVDGEV
ncbi:MAG: FtsK/SpoIIIE domain-containing protein, partial [Actinomycetota bacterium]|nr:FtsK/SpoIIIE domain-containing protein [Actinomycetota bacterium]